MTVVLDTSAVVAHLFREPGHLVVEACLESAVIGAPTAAETISVLLRRGVDLHDARSALLDLCLRIEPLTAAVALRAGELVAGSRAVGLSLGDCCCLALAEAMGLDAVTADRQWLQIGGPVKVRLIR